MKRPSLSVIADEHRPVAERPRSWQRFAARYPEIVAAYDTLSDVCRTRRSQAFVLGHWFFVL